MRRLISIATLAAVLCFPVWAQMRGARSGFARPAGVSHAPAMAVRPTARGMGDRFGGRFGGNFGRPGGFGFRHHHHHHHFFGAGFGSYGYPWMYAYYPGGYWDYYPLDYDFDYDQSYSNQSYSQNQQLQDYEMQVMNNQQQIEQRLEALENRMDALLTRKSLPPPVRQQSGAEQSKAEPSPALVLVYRDGHTQEVHNYAIVGQTLWVLNERQAKKIPLSELDLGATRKANQDRDIDLALPGSNS